jgi:predicted enzyme related to lactoylglutathione lyase
MQAEIAGEPIDEIFLGKEGQAGPGLILMKYVDRPAPENGELLLVFTTDDIDALVDSVRAAGGGVYVEPFQSDVTPYRAAFTTDPEGHLIENVELTQG